MGSQRWLQCCLGASEVIKGRNEGAEARWIRRPSQKQCGRVGEWVGAWTACLDSISSGLGRGDARRSRRRYIFRRANAQRRPCLAVA